MIELVFAFLENFSWVAIWIALLTGVALLAFIFSDFFADLEGLNVLPKIRKMRNRLILPFMISIILACVPNSKDLWRVRIDLLKFGLASPENISKASGEIERIGHKLECKYVGCEENKGEKK